MAAPEVPGNSEQGGGRGSAQSSAQSSPGGKQVCREKAIPPAHLTFVIDCARGKRISLATPPAPTRVSSPYRGPVTPPMKTFIMFCGDSCPQLTQDGPPGREGLAQPRHILPPPEGAVAPASFPGSPLCPQEAPKAKGSPSKTGPTKSSAWGTVKGSLKALSSCVCGLAD
ncbi:steroid receptor-associated and regulated protein [Tamandua tetradactyla]|uniref:steroid receptor-associated and regulated protein n=1 Tax=Tamandua tetradactyla TaxID=48850 RepID=UPI0040548615